MNKNTDYDYFKDWILNEGINRENYVFDISEHKDYISKLNEVERSRFKLALKEMLMNNTLLEHKKEKIYILTSLGNWVLNNGGFSAYNPSISSELNINEKFNKNLELNKRVMYSTLAISILSMIFLGIQTYLSTKPVTIKIDRESKLPKKLEKELNKINSKLNYLNPLKDSLKKQLEKQPAK